MKSFNENDTNTYQQVKLLQNENKQLREALSAFSNELEVNNNNPTTAATSTTHNREDKELIKRLTEQVTKATSLNVDLTSRLKLSEGEVESYKKILIEYQNELSEMKLKHLNEASGFFNSTHLTTLFLITFNFFPL